MKQPRDKLTIIVEAQRNVGLITDEECKKELAQFRRERASLGA